jgi:MFS family permease
VSSSDVDCTDDYWSDDCAVEYCNRLDDSILYANTIMSIPYFMAAVMLPFLGGLVDKFGMRAFALLCVPICLLIVHSLMGYTNINPIGLLVGQGLGYTFMAATLWPSFSLIVDKRYTGLAFGIAFSMQNLGLSIIPFIIALIYTDSDDKYIPNVEVFFMSLSAACIVFSVWLNYEDWCNGSILNSPTKTETQRNAGEGSVFSPLSTDDKVTDDNTDPSRL